MHSAIGATDENLDLVDFDFKKSLAASLEDHIFFKIFFPLKWFFFYIDPLIWQGFKDTLQIKDIPDLSKSRKVDSNLKRFNYWWKKLSFMKRDRLFWVMQLTFGFWFWFAGFIQIIYVALQVLTPFFMRLFLNELIPQTPDDVLLEIELYQQYLPTELHFKDSTPKRQNDWSVWLYLLAFSCSFLLASIAQVLGTHMAMIVGMKQRATLTAAMYQKTLRLSSKARNEYETGKIINFISTDTMKIEGINSFFHMGWTSFVTLAASIYFLWDLIDYGMFAALGTPIIVVPFLVGAIFVMIMLRMKIMKITDDRIKKINEFINGIKIVKFFAWEDKYLKKIQDVRKKEVSWIVGMKLVNSFIVPIFSGLFNLMSLAAFTTYFLVHGRLDAIVIFTALSYLQLMIGPMVVIPMILLGIIDCLLSYGRIEKFLCADELEFQSKGMNADFPIIIEDGHFSWEALKKKEVPKTKKKGHPGGGGGGGGHKMPSLKDLCGKKKKDPKDIEMKEKPFELKGINVRIKKGELVMVCGEIGSGKTSLIAGLLSEMKMKAGNFSLTGSVAYCNQHPWIKNETILENVLFGSEMDEKKFDHVIDICCMKPDLKVLKGGRMLVIGEKGSTLSGGQKWRVSLARACYKEADIYLLDDPLSAVDAHVGKKIFNDVIGSENGFLRQKTRVLVTHQVHILNKADHILYMNNGEVEESGTYEELMKDKKKFYELIKGNVLGGGNKKAKNEKKKDVKILDLTEKVVNDVKEKQKKKVDTMKKEEKKKGAVSFDVIMSFVRAGGCGFGTIGWGIMIFIILSYCIVQLCVSGSAWWLSIWSSGVYNDVYGTMYTSAYYLNGTLQNLTNPITNITSEVFTATNNISIFYDPNVMSCPSPYPDHACFERNIEITWDSYSNGTIVQDGLSQLDSLLIYAGSGLTGVALGFVRDVIFGFFCLFAAKRFHDMALKKVGYSPMSFFDQTPVGRILNRFSTDFEIMDFRLSRGLSGFMALLLSALGTFGLMAYATIGIFLPFLIIFVILYIGIYLYYRQGCIELKRLYSVSRSPLLSNVQETLTGLSTIRAYAKVGDFEKENKLRIDLNNCCYYQMISAQRWLGSRLQFIGFIIILLVSSIVILLAFYIFDANWVYQNIGMLSLAVSYSFTVSFILSNVFRTLTESEVLLNSVERLDYYCNDLEVEAKAFIEDKDTSLLKQNWPQRGAIEFKDLFMKYRSELPFVLRDVNLKIKPGEKIGVVGRTGAGKSSLAIALWRLVEPLNGTILIDGIDYKEIGLKTLRQKMAIIPQDSVLFSGSIRSNMDPFGEYEDREIIENLKLASLSQMLERAGGLDGVVQEGGENFSAGERQLMCLARAILKKSRILVLDECTASVDVDTDKVIQKLVREQTTSTIITIAHRLQTIVDYDKILVMDNGKVGEFDTPLRLIMKKRYKLFKELVSEGGKDNAKFLMNLIIKNSKRRSEKVEEVKKSKDSEEIVIDIPEMPMIVENDIQSDDEYDKSEYDETGTEGEWETVTENEGETEWETVTEPEDNENEKDSKDLKLQQKKEEDKDGSIKK